MNEDEMLFDTENRAGTAINYKRVAKSYQVD